MLYTSRNIESLNPEQIDIRKIYKKDERNKANSFIIISSNSNEEKESENQEKDEKWEEKKHKISELTLLYIDYVYQILKIFVTTTNDDRKDEIVDKLFKTTKEILMDTNNLVSSRYSGRMRDEGYPPRHRDMPCDGLQASHPAHFHGGGRRARPRRAEGGASRFGGGYAAPSAIRLRGYSGG